MDKSHCLGWLFDKEKDLLHCTDSQGATDPEGNAIPIQVTAPFPGSQDALTLAGQHCTREQQGIYATTEQRITRLGKTACLLIYRKSPGA